MLFGLKVVGLQHIPRKGPVILVSNHQSWFDPPLLGATFPRELHYAAKAELFRTPVLSALVKYYNSIPVKRSGYDRALLQRLAEVLTAGGAVLIFPEGTRYLDGRLHPPKAGVGMLALKHAQVPVVPACVTGSARLRRQVLGRRLRVAYGPSFTAADLSLTTQNGKEAYYALADEVMRRIAAVGGLEPPVPGVTPSRDQGQDYSALG